MIEVEKYFEIYEGTPTFKERRSSVHYSDYRFRKAEEQAKMTPVSIDMIIEYINQFLEAIGINKCKSPIIKIKETSIDYKKIKQENNLKDERDIVWLKFTTDGFLGVVATSNDINFVMPESKDVYNEKLHKTWFYNTSGILVHHVNKKWDESFALVFPLKNKPSKYNRGDIERAIGNYLIDKQVPIIDFYSHNY